MKEVSFAVKSTAAEIILAARLSALCTSRTLPPGFFISF
jgi:hypothetical protein